MKHSSREESSSRYIANTADDREKMLEVIGEDSVEAILNSQIPETARLKRPLSLPEKLSEPELIARGREMAGRNADADEYITFLGAGIYDHFVPSAVGEILSREEFYTAYTPYQPEVSQGTLQSIYEYQTLICRLTAMDVSNASMYDGASALAEAAVMGYGINSRKKIIVSRAVHPTHREVLKTYVSGLPIEIVEAPYANGVTDVDAVRSLVDDQTIGLIVQQPNFFGMIEPVLELEKEAHRTGGLYIVSVDPISLGLLKPPGEYNADIVVGEGQALGNQMNYGGPILGIFASKQDYMRKLPGRLVGATVDKNGKRVYVLTLQTREQHIRREHATSNICTNQALMALGAAVYLSLMGKSGIRRAAELSYQKAHYAAETLEKTARLPRVWDGPFFKEFAVRVPELDPDLVSHRLLDRKMIGGLPLGKYYPELADAVLIAVTEQRTKAQIDLFAGAMSEIASGMREGARFV